MIRAGAISCPICAQLGQSSGHDGPPSHAMIEEWRAYWAGAEWWKRKQELMRVKREAKAAGRVRATPK